MNIRCQNRAMAVGITSMVGRMGSVVNSNIIGLLLDDHCEIVFSSAGILLFGT